MEIRVDTKEIKKLLQKGQKALQDMKPVMRDIAQMMRSTVNKNFEVEGRDESGRTHTWKPLAPSTQKRRAEYKGEQYKAHPILEFTGRLKQSINTAYGKNWAQVYTGVEYAVHHQTGTKKVPARPFMVMPKQDLADIEKHLKSWLERELKP